MKRAFLIMGLHVVDRGFGWIVFETAVVPLDWGVVEKKRANKNAQCLSAFERLIARYPVELIVVEGFLGGGAARAKRIRRLYRSILSVAKQTNIMTRIYSRSEIRQTFVNVGARSRYEIARATAERLEAIRHRLPRKRPPWEAERPNMALFAAAACALAHFAIAAEGKPNRRVARR